MFLHFKEPLRSLRRIGLRPWYNHSLQSSRPHHIYLTRSYSSLTALQPLSTTTIDVIPNQPLRTIRDYQRLMTSKDLDNRKIVQLFHDAKSAGLQPSPSMYKMTVKAYGSMGDSKQVTRTFKEFNKKYKLNPSAYQVYVKAVLDSNDLQTAHKVFLQILRNPKLKAKEASFCLAALMPVYNKHNQTELAVKTVQQLYTSTKVDEWDYNARNIITSELFSVYSKEPITATSLESMVAQHPPVKSQLSVYTMLLSLFSTRYTPTVHTCNLILDAQSNARDFAGMKTVLSLMQKLNLHPTIETVSVLLRTFGSSLSTDDAAKLYASWKHDPTASKSFINIFAPDSVHMQHVMEDLKKQNENFRVLAEGFVKRNEFDQGLQWLRDSHCEDMDSYAVLMEGLLQRGQWKACVSQYDTLIRSFAREKVDTNRRIVKCMLTAQFSQNKMDVCDAYLESQLMFKFTRNTVIRILNTLMSIQDSHGLGIVRGHTIVKALKVLESRLHVYLDAEGISRVITQLGDRGECSQGYDIYNWIRQHGHQSARERCGSSKIYKAMMYSAIKNNNSRILERAWVDLQYREQFFGKCVKVTNDVSAFNMLLNGYASQLPRPDLVRLKRTFKKMLDLELEPNLGTYNVLIKAFVNAENMDGAKQIYQKMIDSNIKPDARTTNTILHGWILQKDWGQVENFVQDMRKRSKRNLDIVTFNILVKCFLKLDSKSIPYEQLLKRQRKWHALHYRVDQQQKPNMSSETIWSIFKSTTGYSKDLLSIPVDSTNPDEVIKKLYDLKIEPTQNPNAFIKLFSNTTEPNQITYKLFMKAFVNIGDYESAARIREWMTERLPSL